MPRRSKGNLEPPEILRRRAETVWRNRRAEISATNCESDPTHLLHELEVHQIELELQNSELRRSRSALEQAHDELLELYDFAPVGYLTLDRNTVIRKANQKAASMLGVERVALPGLNFRRFCAVGREADSFWLSLGEEREQNFELRLRSSDGSEFEALVETAAPIEPGAGLLWRCTLTDISRRKQADNALRESRAKLAAALASMADAVIITDAQGNFIDFNEAAAKFCRFPSKEECPRTLDGFFEIFELLLPDGAPAAQDLGPLQRALRGETISGTEYTYRRKDTRETWIGNVSFGPIRGKDGGILGAVFVARDVTEQKRIEERQRHAQKLESVGILAGGVAHDFNNLLTSILGNASILQMDAALGQNQRLTTIIESSERAAALTRQLLAYAGKGHFEITDFDLWRLVRSSADLIRVSIPKNIELHLEVPASLPLVRGDSSQIQQVVMNLVINAAEAIEGGAGKVTVSASTRDFDAAAAARISPNFPAGRYLSLQVEDNGCGMDAATKERIFDPFFTTKFTGRGLGLAAVQGILRAQNGAIQVESAVGHGTTFTIYLPVSQAPAATRTSGTAARMTGTRAGTILVVDDEERVRSFMQAALEMFGYRVLLAENGRQAEKVLSRNTGVDLVVLDIVMPVFGGAEALHEFRKRWPDLPFLVVSGNSRTQVENLGIPPEVPFLEKPYTIDRLARAVDKALQSRVRTNRG